MKAVMRIIENVLQNYWYSCKSLIIWWE